MTRTVNTTWKVEGKIAAGQLSVQESVWRLYPGTVLIAKGEAALGVFLWCFPSAGRKVSFFQQKENAKVCTKYRYPGPAGARDVGPWLNVSGPSLKSKFLDYFLFCLFFSHYSPGRTLFLLTSLLHGESPWTCYSQFNRKSKTEICLSIPTKAVTLKLHFLDIRLFVSIYLFASGSVCAGRWLLLSAFSLEFGSPHLFRFLCQKAHSENSPLSE